MVSYIVCTRNSDGTMNPLYEGRFFDCLAIFFGEEKASIWKKTRSGRKTEWERLIRKRGVRKGSPLYYLKMIFESIVFIGAMILLCAAW